MLSTQRAAWLAILSRAHWLAMIFTLAGCGTAYEGTALKAWDQMASGKTDDALKNYDKNVTDKKDELLRLMDEGILLRVAGKYKESNQKFLDAARIIDMNGYLNVKETAVTLLTNEKQSTYQGEDFEKTLIHAYLAMNFIELKDWDGALVETRRVNEILFKFISEGKRPYEMNAFSRYLGGILFEVDHEVNDAFIAYKNTFQISPVYQKLFPLQVDILRTAKLNGFNDEYQEFAKKFGEAPVKAAEDALRDGKASVVFLFESGKSPQKYSSKEKHIGTGKGGTTFEVLLPVPYYKTRPSDIASARIRIQDQMAQTVTFNDVENMAIKHLKSRMGREIGKAIAAAAVKIGVATAVGTATDNKDLGVLAGIALMLISEADTRSWLLLPQKFQVARLFVPPGKYDVTLEYLNNAGAVAKTEKTSVNLKPREISFLERRAFQ